MWGLLINNSSVDCNEFIKLSFPMYDKLPPSSSNKAGCKSSNSRWCITFPLNLFRTRRTDLLTRLLVL